VSRVRRPQGDDGQLLILIAFFAVVLILFVAVVVDVSAAFLARRGLASQADGAALNAAQSLDLDAFYAGRTTDGLLPLGDVEQAVNDYVSANFPDTEVVAVDLTDGDTAVEVTLRRHLALPLSPPGYEGGVDVTAAATARLPLRP
jgi:Flp pilus assembly protein TadG